MKKLIALLLAAVMVLSLFAGCKKEEAAPSTNAPTDAPTVPTETVPAAEPVGLDWDAIAGMDYDDACDVIYNYNLGEFYEYYQAAKAELDDLDVRAALMAVAEAKLMESGVFGPCYGDGGSFAISRVVPRSGTTALWGLDENKFYTYLVCNELIKSEDRDALIALWSEAADAAEWDAAAKAFLEEKGYTLNDTYNYETSYLMNTWDVIATSEQSNSYFIASTYTGLMEYDTKNILQPAMAESYEVSDDGLTYTFHIRKGVNWVDQQGRVIGEVTADDWVASMQHLADNNDELGYLMSADGGCGIKNYDAYINGEAEWADVGVKAEDDYTLVYTLEARFPAFVTMLGYGCFAPLNRSFYKAQGGTFGAEGDEYTAGNYGTGPSTIAYCGAYLVSNYTEENVTSYVPNPEYWNPDAVNTHYINFYYNDGSETTRAYTDTKDNVSAACALNASALVLAKEEIPEGEGETYFDLYSYTTTNSATHYTTWMNINRNTWTLASDTTAGVSAQTPEDAVRTRAAMNNQNFRLALNFAFDRGAFNATGVGEELKYARLKNSYTPGTFLVMSKDVTIDINGTPTTFPAGTFYGAIEQAQLDADGFKVKVWDPTADGGAGSGDGFDGWFDPEQAAAYMETAIAELAAAGVEVSAENPILIDVPVYTASESITNRHNAYKQSIENNLNGCVIVNLVEYADAKSYQSAYYYTADGKETNYDVAPGMSGWGPDYGDAQSYLDTIQPYGYMAKCIGLY